MSLDSVACALVEARLREDAHPNEAYDLIEGMCAQMRRSTRADHESIDYAVDCAYAYQEERRSAYLRKRRREALAEAFEHERIKAWRWLRLKHFVLVNVYEVHRCYGGPEEGGWWYDAGIPVHTEIVWRPLAPMVAARLENEYSNEGRRELSSVLSDGIYDVVVNDGPPGSAASAYPSEIPHYE